MAKKSTPIVKAATKPAAKSISKKVVPKRPPLLYPDVIDPEKRELYLDTWMPVERSKIKEGTVIYADTWIPASVLRKGRKPGMYADTWMPPGGVKLKQKKQ